MLDEMWQQLSILKAWFEKMTDLKLFFQSHWVLCAFDYVTRMPT